jgi:uncharacterized protein
MWFMCVSFKGLLLAFISLLGVSGATNAQVVISQVYGGGGNSGAPFRSDFIELHNNGVTTVDLSTWSVQYSSSTGAAWTRTNLTGSIAAGAYYLIKQADGTGTTLPALPTPDLIGTIAMSGTAGKVALVNNQTTLAGACPLGATVADFVGFGVGTNCSETSPTAPPSNTTSVIRAGNGCTDSGNNSADFTTGAPNPRNSASTASLCSVVGLPLLAVNDLSVLEGDTGTITMNFSVSLSAPAGVGGVSFTYATADGTATAGSDYVSASGMATIAEGATSTTVTVTINGDLSVEGNETFFVNLSSVVGATVSDGQGQGTITNDDIVLTPIHAIQGSGDASPVVGITVSTRGVVTGLRNTGFFMQSTDADADADPTTSQGIFVFTNSAPTVARGDLLIVTGNVVEFFQLTEIGNPVISVLSSGNAMPTAITLTVADGALSSPERYESMRVIPNLTVVAPAGGNENEPNATATSTGNFHGVLPGVARPFREPGISVLDTFVPAAGVTRFDANLELIVVQSKGLGGAAMNPNAGDVMTGITGILDFGFGFYKFYPDSGQTFTSSVTPTAVSNATPEEFTVAGFNLFRFFDSVNDPANSSDPVLTTTALNNRLAKTSDAICGYLKTPDIIGVVEVENIDVLTQLANTINTGQVAGGAAVPSCNAAPNYVPYLVEGNDVGGIDVGFLISTKLVGTASTPRVEVLEVVQENKNEIVTNPDASTGLLNDRPTLRLQAVIHNANGASYPLTVMINHLRSLGSVNDPVDGPRVRNKRLKQAESLARLIQNRQVANPNEKIVLLGDFNAFEFNDGFVDSMGIITGKEVPANEVTLYSGFVVTTPLTNMTTVDVPNQRYSFSFDGNAQSLDHAVVNEALLMKDGVRSEHARINSDFAVINYGIYGGAPTRVSDHDPVILFIKPRSFVNVDLGVAVSNPDTNINAGSSTTFQVTASHVFAQTAVNNAQIAIVIDAAINGVTVTSSGSSLGWTCTAPVVSATNTTINCTAALLSSGTTQFTVTVPTPATFAGGDLTLSASISAEQGDNQTGNNMSSDVVNVNGQITDLAIQMRGPSQIIVGKKALLTATLDNRGSKPATGVSVALTVNVPGNEIAINTPAGWTCAQHSRFADTRFLCAINGDAPFNAGAQLNFELRFTASAAMANNNLIVGAGVSSITVDSSAANNSDSYSARVELIRKIPKPMPRD